MDIDTSHPIVFPSTFSSLFLFPKQSVEGLSLIYSVKAELSKSLQSGIRGRHRSICLIYRDHKKEAVMSRAPRFPNFSETGPLSTDEEWNVSAQGLLLSVFK